MLEIFFFFFEYDFISWEKGKCSAHTVVFVYSDARLVVVSESVWKCVSLFLIVWVMVTWLGFFNAVHLLYMDLLFFLSVFIYLLFVRPVTFLWCLCSVGHCQLKRNLVCHFSWFNKSIAALFCPTSPIRQEQRVWFVSFFFDYSSSFKAFDKIFQNKILKKPDLQ